MLFHYLQEEAVKNHENSVITADGAAYGCITFTRLSQRYIMLTIYISVYILGFWKGSERLEDCKLNIYRKLPSYGMLRLVARVRTEVSEERVASIIIMTRIGEL
jgi:hypothetical protein